MDIDIREPKQKRAIEKKEKIIKEGFELICKNGYHNTNTKEIAKKANVSTGIVYQYFKDKYDIFMEGLEKYGDDIFFPVLKINENFDINNFDKIARELIKEYIDNHKLSKNAHEEITSMIHSDPNIAKYYYKKELEVTKNIKDLLIKNNFKDENLDEKVHIMIGIIDNLCHEVTFHKHKTMNYDIMIDIAIATIKNIFKEK